MKKVKCLVSMILIFFIMSTILVNSSYSDPSADPFGINIDPYYVINDPPVVSDWELIFDWLNWLGGNQIMVRMTFRAHRMQKKPKCVQGVPCPIAVYPFDWPY